MKKSNNYIGSFLVDERIHQPDPPHFICDAIGLLNGFALLFASGKANLKHHKGLC